MEYALYRFLARLSGVLVDRDHVRIRRHVIDYFDSYEVKEEELSTIEREGSDLGIDFQVGTSTLTLAASFLANLLLTSIESRKVFDTFIVIVVVGALFGLTHLYKWHRHRGIFSDTIRTIRERRIGPVGTEDHELASSDLTKLSSEEPPNAPEGQQ